MNALLDRERGSRSTADEKSKPGPGPGLVATDGFCKTVDIGYCRMVGSAYYRIVGAGRGV